MEPPLYPRRDGLDPAHPTGRAQGLTRHALGKDHLGLAGGAQHAIGAHFLDDLEAGECAADLRDVVRRQFPRNQDSADGQRVYLLQEDVLTACVKPSLPLARVAPAALERPVA